MLDSVITMQRQTRLPEGLAVTWDPIPGAIRYGLIVGFADLPPLDLANLMGKPTPGFAVVGIPTRFSGAVDLGSPIGEERQYGLVAFRADGALVAVPDFQLWPARQAPRDREYHPIQPPPLDRPPAPLQAAGPVEAEPSGASGPEPDPWSALDQAARTSPALTPGGAEPPGLAARYAHESQAADTGVRESADDITVSAGIGGTSFGSVAGPDIRPVNYGDRPLHQPSAHPSGNADEARSSDPTAYRAPEVAPAAPLPARQPATDQQPVLAAVPEPPETRANLADGSADGLSRVTASGAQTRSSTEHDTNEVPTHVTPPETTETTIAMVEPPDSAATAGGTMEPVLEVQALHPEPSTPAAMAWVPEHESAPPSATYRDGVSERATGAIVPSQPSPLSAEDLPATASPEGTSRSGTPGLVQQATVTEPVSVEAAAPHQPAEPSDQAAGSTTAAVPAMDAEQNLDQTDQPIEAPVGAAESPTAPVTPAAVAALLDEAAVYLLPQWADFDQAARLLDQAGAIAPADARLAELRAQLREARAAGDATESDDLLHDAADRISAKDYWGAVSLYEHILASSPDNVEARRGLARARNLARWSSHMAGAGADPERLQRVGDEFMTESPDLAAQAFEAAFELRPAIITLRGWLCALGQDGQRDALVNTARACVETLRRSGRIPDDLSVDDAVMALEQIDVVDADAVATAIERLIERLVASTARSNP